MYGVGGRINIREEEVSRLKLKIKYCPRLMGGSMVKGVKGLGSLRL